MGERPAADAFGGLDGVVANVSALAIPETPENWRTSVRRRSDGHRRPGRRRVAPPAGRRRRIDRDDLQCLGREVDFAAGPYGTMKAAIIHYTQGVAYKLAAQGVRANSVSPGNTYFPGGVWPSIEENNPELFARRSRSTRPGGWRPRRRSPTRWCSCPVRRPASSPERTSSSTAR